MFFCASLKVFLSEIDVYLYAQIYKFHVNEVNQLYVGTLGQ
jgi:hypothetical protein